MKSRTKANVLRLVKKFPQCKYSYSRLVYCYWKEYNESFFSTAEYPYLVSPESICRAYRTLVMEGSIKISLVDKIRRSNLAQKVKEYFAIR